MALTQAARIELVQKMYVAYYGRPADPVGLNNWVGHLARNNDDPSAIMNAFGTSPEATSLYGNPPNYTQAVNNLYMQMFNRAAEPAGLALYVEHLTAGRVTLSDLALTIAKGAQNSDATTLNNKVAIAIEFTQEVASSTENILGYDGADAAAHASAFLATVTSAAASVTAAQAALESTIDMINGLDQLSSLPTHMLTTGLDNLIGTNGNDVVLATFDDVDTTLELDDSFNALLGQDTLRLDVLEDATFDSADYHMVGFERVLVQARNENVDVTLDLADMAGVELEVRNMVGGDDGDLRAENIDADVLVVNFDGDDIELNVVGGDVSLNRILADDIVVGAIETLDGADLWAVGGVAGDVTLTAISEVDDIAVVGLGGSLTMNSVEGIDYTTVEFADTVASGVINLDGVDHDENMYVGGLGLTSLTINATGEASDLNELDLEFIEGGGSDFSLGDSGNLLSSVIINANTDLTIDDLELNEEADETDVTTSLTINGSGNVEINGFHNEDIVDVVYTGSGSLVLGTYDDNGDIWDMVQASFNASTATGDVTLYLDLNESLDEALDSLDFTYVGSKGNDRVVIEEDSLGEAAADLDVIALSIEGGTGTDTLVVLDDSDLSTAALSKVSGFETVELTGFDNLGETFNLANAGEFTNVVLSSDINANSNEDIIISGLTATQAQNISVMFDGYAVNRDGGGNANIDEFSAEWMFNDLTFNLASTSGTTDVASIEFVTDVTQAYVPAGDWGPGLETVSGVMTVNGVETINLSTVGGQNTGLAAEALVDAPFEDLGTFVSIREMDANALQTLNVSGSASLSIRGLNADNLTTIDARSFTGAYLELGGYDWYDNADDAVDTDLDLVVHGSATADHNIRIDGDETVTITTGSGDDDININANEQITVTAGAGDNHIHLDSYYEGITVTTGDGRDDIYAYADDDIIITAGAGLNYIWADSDEGDVTITTLGGDDVISVDEAEDVIVGAGNGNNRVAIGGDYESANDFAPNEGESSISQDVTVTTGTGEDDVYVYDGEDVTVTSGADEDYIFIDSEVGGAVIIDAGSQNDEVEIDVDTAVESFRITLGAGVDTLTVNSSAFNDGAINEFFVTDFVAGTGGDILNLERTNGTNNQNPSLDKDFEIETSADGEYTFSTSNATTAILEFAFDAVNASSNLATIYSGVGSTVSGDQLLTALGSGGNSASITVADETDGYIIAYSGGDAFLFHFDTDIDGVIQTSGISESTDSTDDETTTWTLSAGNGDGWEAGDVITVSDLDTGNGVVSFTYIVNANDDFNDIGMALAQGITFATGSDYNATYLGGVLTVVTDNVGDETEPGSTINITVSEATNTTTLVAGDITLVGVLDNVAVGSLANGNFSLFNDLA